jgi:type VI secretion system protein ImpC
MSMQFASGNVDFELRTLTLSAPLKAAESTPFCIAVLGDFSGRGNLGLCETGPALAARRRIAVDVDNFEQLPTQLGTELHLPPRGKEGPCVAVRFGTLDDFHPDRIFDRLEIFQKLRDTRKRLQDPATFAEAASQVRSWVVGRSDAPEPEPAQPPSSQPESRESDADTIERLLGKPAAPQQPPPPARRFLDIDQLISEAVKPYIVPSSHPQQAEIVTQVDQAISGQMRSILHNPDFRKLEATWRALHFLLGRLETDETLKIYAVDISKAELAADLSSAESLESTGMYRLLVEQSVGTEGADPWAILLGCYRFDKTEKDVDLLGRLARIGQAAGAPFIAAANPHYAGCESFGATPNSTDWQWRPDPAAAQRWRQLRRSAEAASAGLVLPRFLLRLPYGKDTEPIDSFDFDELPRPTEHDRYLWGNGAVLCACLLGAAFREAGWSLTAALRQELMGLPMYVCRSDSETHVTPCAEAFLTERGMQLLINEGLMPLLSVKGRDAVRLPRFQSIAEPAAPLAGRWR